MESTTAGTLIKSAFPFQDYSNLHKERVLPREEPQGHYPEREYDTVFDKKEKLVENVFTEAEKKKILEEVVVTVTSKSQNLSESRNRIFNDHFDELI